MQRNGVQQKRHLGSNGKTASRKAAEITGGTLVTYKAGRRKTSSNKIANGVRAATASVIISEDNSGQVLYWSGKRLCLRDGKRVRLISWRESVEWLARTEEASDSESWNPHARIKYYRLLARQLLT